MANPFPHGTVHEAREDIQTAMRSDPKVFALWESLTPLGRNEFICWIDDAKLSIDVSRAHIWDLTGVNAIDKAVLKFRKSGVDVEVVGLNEASATIMDKLAMHDRPDAMEKVLGLCQSGVSAGEDAGMTWASELSERQSAMYVASNRIVPFTRKRRQKSSARKPIALLKVDSTRFLSGHSITSPAPN